MGNKNCLCPGDLWNYIKTPEKGQFVLVINSVDQDFPSTEGYSTDKNSLIAQGEKISFPRYCSSKIYDHNKKEVWSAGFPSTLGLLIGPFWPFF